MQKGVSSMLASQWEACWQDEYASLRLLGLTVPALGGVSQKSLKQRRCGKAEGGFGVVLSLLVGERRSR